MAATSGRKTSSSRKTTGKTGNRAKSDNTRKQIDAYQAERDSAMFHEIGLIVLFIAALILFFCNFGIIGPVGGEISKVLFGVFGFTAYIAPVLLFVSVAFWFANEGNPTAVRKLVAGTVLFLMLGVVCDLIAGSAVSMDKYDLKELYDICSSNKKGGGVLAGSIAYLLHHYLETIGTVLVVILCSVISGILLTERSLLGSVKSGGTRIRERTREDAQKRKEYARARRKEQERLRAEREEERRLRAEEKENEKILRMEKKVTGVTADTSLKEPEEQRHTDDIHEIRYEEGTEEPASAQSFAPAFDFEKIKIRSAHQVTLEEADVNEAPVEERPQGSVLENAAGTVAASARPQKAERLSAAGNPAMSEIRIHREDIPEQISPSGREGASPDAGDVRIHKEQQNVEKKAPAKYMFPPLSRLQKGKGVAGDSTKELKETAMRLQQTLNTFGVKVTITDISQGPSVTRYELQPEQGVKVSKIVGLSDDIKLNLAATDIRIEAPIPGKAAIGIEVPNKENMAVALRDLLESKEFKEFPSNIAFAVGKDIAGKVVVADIAKMPHMLIAGATGSGKSVCINTLIMSILYKAHPDDVKLIMVDPKVVELSVYNGIPHLLIPVVTDPKKASAALHWGVTEMEERYRRFADFNVRDLKGYNEKVESLRENGDESAPAKMPQIVIIVDELADLMMVCPGEVEESICRLAQLARAAGIHLIIATQRPSVDVITGLIKANMPSRVAFAVSSGVDSRTILDMNGAEKLLGKGDMLFYPQSYTKPARIQGAFVSDKEVSDVVDFLKNQTLGNTYAEDVEEKIQSIGSSGGPSGGGGSDNSRDEYFAEAGRFIIDKDKASIGMLQRVLKIGFNRAARIMDQLCEYGVVGEEEGTKPRKVLMSMEQFEQLLEEI
ncbi:MAG: DNA translocase FtsK [Lachnospiraceae bacterium]|nr:DNA translocase FtsK [Lachnospiraceae bacterium]